MNTRSRNRKKPKNPELRPTMQAATWEAFSRWVGAHDGINWIFRGVTDLQHELRPKIGRPSTREKGKGYLPQHEKWLLDEFRRMATAFITTSSEPKTEWDWLTLAQHHRLPTRLLDWSFSPLVAAFFAVEHEGANGDALIYAHKPLGVVVPHTIGPFQYPEVSRFDPAHISPRVSAQSATFTIHPNPTSIFKPVKGLRNLIIKKNFCGPLKGRLNNLGINRSTLFPELDGVSAYLTWLNSVIIDKPDYPISKVVFDHEAGATQLVQEFGNVAPEVVKKKISELQDGGDVDSARNWKQVLKKVDNILSGHTISKHSG